MKKFLPIAALFILTCINMSFAQTYTDYIGAGHSDGIVVTSCDEQTKPYWTQSASSMNSINGSGMNAEYFAAARFLSQAAFGKTPEEIQNVVNIGYEAWIDDQFTYPVTSTLETAFAKFDEINAHNVSLGYDPTENLSAYNFNMAWFDNAVNRPDQLRQRVALALSEILVISNNSDLEGFGEASSDYYDIFLNEAFGNYENILRKVTLHPAMGFYLSHYNNPKADPELGTHPDENYAREILQLFSVGLYELNQDGSHKLDAQGNSIQTYTQDDIKEFAKVFTGLSAGAVAPEIEWADEPYFGLYYGACDFTYPMSMYDEFHEPGPKFLFNDFQLNGNLNGMDEVIAAVNNIFNHENVGPIVSLRLIQRLIKSNPTPGYISRVAGIFNNNGQGVRGDMTAVIKAILLDSEARDCSWIDDPSNGKLKEPIVKFTEYYKAFNFNLPGGYSWNPGYNYQDATDQYPMASPSVFNFYTPSYQPNGPILNANLVAPEFQILQTRTSMGYINWVNNWTQGGYPYYQWEDIETVLMDFTQLKQMSRDPEVYINYLDGLFVNGKMSQSTRDIISDALYEFTVTDNEDENFYLLEYRAKLGLYLTLISPDYNILK